MKFIAVACGFLIACIAQADTTHEYVVIFDGKTGGRQTTVIGENGRVRVRYTHRDNGRGPDLEEDILLAADGTFLKYRLTGKTTFGAVLDETFVVNRDRASWRSTTERGAQRLESPAMYLPNYRSPETGAMIVRATQRAGGRLPGLPGGELRSERLKQLRIGAAGQERAVALYAIHGADLQPDYVWLDDDPDMRLFASINVGSRHLVADGYGGVAAELERAQKSAEADYLRAIAAQQARHLQGPILIRNVRPFDTKSASRGAASDVYVHQGRITAIYPAGSPPRAAATVIEGAGRALLPRLFDMH
jgi:hypothetical protein